MALPKMGRRKGTKQLKQKKAIKELSTILYNSTLNKKKKKINNKQIPIPNNSELLAKLSAFIGKLQQEIDACEGKSYLEESSTMSISIQSAGSMSFELLEFLSATPQIMVRSEPIEF